MLTNGLGDLLLNESRCHARFVDLFAGSAAVSWFVGQNVDVPVLSSDLQEYSKILAESVICRTTNLDATPIAELWSKEATQILGSSACARKSLALENPRKNTVTWAAKARELCSSESDVHDVLWSAYGGHYLSPLQAITVDALRQALPLGREENSACHAAVIMAISKCVAAPGHTAQPFRPTGNGGRYLRQAWQCDILEVAVQKLHEICNCYARKQGKSQTGDALELAERLECNDLVFLDPPYSGVHYSRFYHVLETAARQKCSEVSGVGRYPPQGERPNSDFSKKRSSEEAFTTLLSRLSDRGCTVILTFPTSQCSNGLSGELVNHIASRYFEIVERKVKTLFSTMGGNNLHRSARRLTEELILVMKPK